MRRHLAWVLAGALAAGCATSSPGGGYAQGEPPPPSDLPPPPPDALGSYAGVPAGEWVLTSQYGWVWMPYSDAYAYVPPGGVGEPLEYLYYPSYGWSWFSAPWIWGVGPGPRFGRAGPRHFAWYEHGWWREPRRWSYRPAPEPRGRQDPRVAGVRPAPPPARPAPGQARPGPQQPRSGPAVQGRRGDGRREGGVAAPAPAPGAPQAAPERGRRGGEAAPGPARPRPREGDRDRERREGDERR